jgi:hypothetical protein
VGQKWWPRRRSREQPEAQLEVQQPEHKRHSKPTAAAAAAAAEREGQSGLQRMRSSTGGAVAALLGEISCLVVVYHAAAVSGVPTPQLVMGQLLAWHVSARMHGH